MRAAMEENERQLNLIKQTYEERLQQEIQQKSEKKNEKEDRKKLSAEKRENPYLSNLNFDEQLSGKIIFIIRKGSNTVGKSEDCTIPLLGPSIQEHHAVISRSDNGKVILERCSDDCRVLLNGDPVTHKVNLSHNDRLLFGTTQLFVFIHPEQKLKSKMTYADVTFELAQEEIATKAGFAVNTGDQSMEQALLNKDLLEVIPAVDEANAISEELEKFVRFEIMLVSPHFLGKSGERTEVFISLIVFNFNSIFDFVLIRFISECETLKVDRSSSGLKMSSSIDYML